MSLFVMGKTISEKSAQVWLKKNGEFVSIFSDDDNVSLQKGTRQEAEYHLELVLDGCTGKLLPITLRSAGAIIELEFTLLVNAVAISKTLNKMKLV